MANSGEVRDAFSGRSNFKSRVAVAIDTRDAANNRSKWDYSLRVDNDNNGSETWSGGTPKYSLSIGGVLVRNNITVPAGTFDFRDGASYHNIYLGTTGWIAHDGTGTLNLQVSASIGSVGVFGSSSIPSTVVVTDQLSIVPRIPSPLDAVAQSSSSIRYRFSSNGVGSGTFLRWEAQWSTSSTFSSGNGPIVTSSGTTTFEDLERGTTYYFRARGVNTVGTGGWTTSILSATTLHTVPDAPSGVAVSNIAPTQFDFDISEPAYVGAGVTGREVQISATEAFTAVLQTKTTDTGTFSGLTRYTQYWRRARLQNAIGWGAWSTPEPVRTAAALPVAPTGYGTQDISATSVTITSGSVSDNGGASLTDQRVEYNTSASSSGSTTVENGFYGVTTLTGLVKNTLYYYRVSVKNVAGWGPAGSWQSFTTKNNVPEAPTGLAASSITGTTATLGWTLPSQLNGSTLSSVTLQVARNAAFGEGLQTFNLGAAVTNQVVTGLTAATKYYARVWTNSNNGLGSTSATIDFTTSGSVSTPKPLWWRIAGVWKQGIWWIKVAGVWKQATVWQRISGVWKNQ